MDAKKDFKPYVPADQKPLEFTPVSVLLGLILAVVFGGANAYLGLRVGLTVSASIPAAVISMGIIRVVMKRDSVLENNMVQTIGSAGESLAAGAIFTIPALFMWAQESSEVSKPGVLAISVIALCGGILGVLFMVPLRTALIVEEHGVLPFPEGSACAEVLLAGEKDEGKSKLIFQGLGFAAAFKFVADGLKLFNSEVAFDLKRLRAGFGFDALPALVGVGFICGRQISSFMFGGGLLAWFVLIPLISLFGVDSIIAPGTTPISELGSAAIWSSYIRYIGAGAVATGGVISLVKSLPIIVKTFAVAIKGFGHKEETQMRTNHDLPMTILFGGAFLVAVIIWLIPIIPVGLIGALIIVVLGFFFATVSSRMVGLVGSSNNPVSGMAIASLLLATAIMKATGHTGMAGMTSAICIGTIICIVAAMAGDTSQDLKTGYILGSTPYLQQIGELLGALVAALSIGGVMYLLDAAWSFGSAEIPAPQATLMKLVVEGVMGGTLPWGLVLSGVFISIMLEILGLSALTIAIGLYLPIYTSVPIFIGGMLRDYFDRREDKAAADDGILFASGLIAGEGLVGILLALVTIIKVGGRPLVEVIDLGAPLGDIGGVLGLLLICVCIVLAARSGKRS